MELCSDNIWQAIESLFPKPCCMKLEMYTFMLVENNTPHKSLKAFPAIAMASQLDHFLCSQVLQARNTFTKPVSSENEMSLRALTL